MRGKFIVVVIVVSVFTFINHLLVANEMDYNSKKMLVEMESWFEALTKLKPNANNVRGILIGEITPDGHADLVEAITIWNLRYVKESDYWEVVNKSIPIMWSRRDYFSLLYCARFVFVKDPLKSIDIYRKILNESDRLYFNIGAVDGLLRLGGLSKEEMDGCISVIIDGLLSSDEITRARSVAAIESNVKKIDIDFIINNIDKENVKLDIKDKLLHIRKGKGSVAD